MSVGNLIIFIFSMVDALQAATTVAESKDSGANSSTSSRRGSKSDDEAPNWNDAKRMLAEIAANDEVDAAALTLQQGDLENINVDRDEDRSVEVADEDDEEDYDRDHEDCDVDADAKEDTSSNSLEYSRTQRRVSQSKEHVRGGFDVGNNEQGPLSGTTKIKYEHTNDTTLGMIYLICVCFFPNVACLILCCIFCSWMQTVHKIEITENDEKSELSETVRTKKQGHRDDMDGDEYEEDDDETTLAGGNTMLREDEDLWKTAWSQGRGVLNSDRGGYVEDDGDSSLPPSELSTLRKRRTRMLEGLVEDSKTRNINRVGEHVFNRIYELMSTIMYAPVSENATADLAALSATVSEQELMVSGPFLCSFCCVCFLNRRM